MDENKSGDKKRRRKVQPANPKGKVKATGKPRPQAKGKKASRKEKGKKKRLGFSSLENSEIIDKINRFVRYNSFVITIGIIFTFLYLSYKLGDLSDTVSKTLVKNTDFIKENIGHPIFLSATGQVVVAEKSPMGFNDARFIQYIANNLSQAFVGGSVKFSNNYKLVFQNGEDLYKKSPWIKDFADRFLDKKNGYKVLKNFVDGVYFNILDGKFPEYIEPITMKVKSFNVKNLKKDKQTGEFDISVEYKVLVKSWIGDLKQWDTRTVTITINGSGVIDVFRYGDIGNPFGIRFYELNIPVLVKPTARFIMENEKR